MFNNLLIETPRLIARIKQEVRLLNIIFPRLEVRLYVWAIYTQLTQIKISRLLGDKNNILGGDLNKYQESIDMLTIRFTTYLVLLAYDDPIDKGTLNKKQVYDQLSRCLAGFLAGAIYEFPLSSALIKSKFEELRESVKDNADEIVWRELEWLLERNDFLSSIGGKANFNRDDLFYKDYDDINLIELNITIYSAFNLGVTYRDLKQRLADLGHDDNENGNWHETLILINLLKSGYAQANTIDQMGNMNLGMKQYIQIACWKSNTYLDIGGCVRNLLVRSSFLESRFSKARFCEQVLDDVFDYYEDASKGILNFLNLRLIEQGRLAKKIIPLLSRYEMTDLVFINHARTMFEDSSLLKVSYEGSYFFKNPYLQAERDVTLNVIYNKANIEKILKEALVNTQNEVGLDITALLQIRVDLYNQFQLHWEKGELGKCCEIVEISAAPLIIAHSLLVFARKNRAYVIRGRNLAARSSYYYLFLGTLYYSLLKFSVKRCIIVLKNKIKDNLQRKGRL